MASSTLQQLRHWRAEALAAAPQLDAELDWLLREAAQVEWRSLAYAPPEQRLELNCSLAELAELWRRHWQDHEPLQYLVGRSPWRRFELRVGPGVLVPRPETELIVEIARQRADEALAQGGPDLTQGVWVDLGTGSGAIALGLAELFPNIRIHAVDCSPTALAIAAENFRAVQAGMQAKSPPQKTDQTSISDRQFNQDQPNQNQGDQNQGDRIQLHQGQWLEPLQPMLANGLQLQGLVSNPPYIPTAMLADLQPEVRLHEPALALDGGADGLDCLRHLVTAGADSLQPGGLWLVELMAGQAAAVKAMLATAGHYQSITGHFDLCGIERFVSAFRTKSANS
jgi:release factor glutamine methyltransferase